MRKPSTVLIIDQERSYAEALMLALNHEPTLELIGIESTLNDAISRVRNEQADIILTEAVFPDGEVLDRFDELVGDTRPTVVIILTKDTTLSMITRANALGVADVILKSSPLAEIAGALREAANGALPINSTQHLRSHARDDRKGSPGRKDPTDLTDREADVLNYLGEGFGAQEIANALSLSVSTVRSHIKHILAKIGAHTQLEAVVYAKRNGTLEKRTELLNFGHMHSHRNWGQKSPASSDAPIGE